MGSELALQRYPDAATAPACPELTVVVPCYNERLNVAPMVAALERTLAGIPWEVVFVDDNSPDGTAAEARRLAQTDPRVRCLRRIGRRGLSTAVIEGALSSSAPYIAVVDGDLQHDETKLPEMLSLLRDGGFDLVVGTRRTEGGDDAGLSSPLRVRLSEIGGALAQRLLGLALSDPMSGFFAIRREAFETAAPQLSGQGFKILVDLVMSARPAFKVAEVPYKFRQRVAGESKLDIVVLMQFASLLADKALGGLLPLRFITFALVGALGVVVHMAVLEAALKGSGLAFGTSQIIASGAAMIFNFFINNEITYRTQKLKRRALWFGLAKFMLVCSLGAMANIGIARALYESQASWSLSGVAGAAIGVVWNYAVSSTLVWRSR